MRKTTNFSKENPIVTVDRGLFGRAIRLASSVVEKRPTIPVLSCVKMTANGVLVLEGSDLDNFARVEIPYIGDEAEFMLCDPRSVASAISKSGGKAVQFGKDEKRVTLKSGQLDSSLIAPCPDDFISCERITAQQFGCTIGGAELAQIKRVMPAVSSEETRYYLNGVNVQKIDDWTYRFAATDGHRIMIIDIPFPDAEGELPDNFIIPRRFLHTALTSFAKPKDGLSFRVGSTSKSNQKGKTLDVNTGMARVSISGAVGNVQFELTGKLIDGTYPDYSRIMPNEHECIVRCKRADMVKAIQAITPLSTNKARAVRLTFKAGIICIGLKSPDMGDSRFEIPAEHNLGEDFMVAFNGQYLLDCLNALKGDEVEIGLTDDSSPSTIIDPADTAFKAVLMPMRV